MTRSCVNKLEGDIHFDRRLGTLRKKTFIVSELKVRIIESELVRHGCVTEKRYHETVFVDPVVWDGG